MPASIVPGSGLTSKRLAPPPFAAPLFDAPPPPPVGLASCTFPPAPPRLEPTLPGVKPPLHSPPLAAKLPNPSPTPRRIQDAPLQATHFLLPRIVFPIRSTPPT